MFITGGGSGIGACLVKAFARQAAHVAFVDIDAAVFVIDCLPNMTAAEVTSNTAPLVAHHFGEEVTVGALPREDAGGISFAKAERLIGYRPAHTWRDYLDADGLLLDAPRERLARGETGVQRGRAALT